MGENAKITVEDFAPCGVDCRICDVYKYTTTGKIANYDEMIKGWTALAKQHWGMDTLDPSLVRCTGCRYGGEDRFLSPQKCPMRSCVFGRNLTSCAQCSEVVTCQRAYKEGIENLRKNGLL